MAAKYILARSAGFCFGVERSIRMAKEALASGACRCLGELIHNRDAVTALEKKGLSVIEKVSELPEGERVIIRAHGVSRAVYDELKNRRARVIDATCPLVERIHKIVREESEKGRADRCHRRRGAPGDSGHLRLVYRRCRAAGRRGAGRMALDVRGNARKTPLRCISDYTNSSKSHFGRKNIKKKMYKFQNI